MPGGLELTVRAHSIGFFVDNGRLLNFELDCDILTVLCMALYWRGGLVLEIAMRAMGLVALSGIRPSWKTTGLK